MASREQPSGETPASSEDLIRRHLRVGWITLALFATLGLTLETLNGFKIGWYLDLANVTRRELWTLAHAHGALLGLLNVAFAATLRGAASRFSVAGLRLGSRALIAATLLMPAGFLLGGIVVFGGDPNPAILLVPAGGAGADTRLRSRGEPAGVRPALAGPWCLAALDSPPQVRSSRGRMQRQKGPDPWMPGGG